MNMNRPSLRNRHPFHNTRLATTLETTGRGAFLRRKRRLQLAANVLGVVAFLLFIASVVLFCWESAA